MKIVEVKSNILRVPTDKLITDSQHSLEHVEVITCDIVTSDGQHGFGFTYTIGTGAFAIKAVIDTIYKKIIIESDPSEIQSLWWKMWNKTHAVGRGGITTHALAAVDIALWDLKGKEVEQPLHRLLNGSRRGVPLYDTDRGWLHYSKDELVKSALEIQREGFFGFKMKVGKKTLGEDIDRITSVMDALEGKLPVMIDANQIFSPSEAIQRGRAFEKLGVYWYEEPIVADDVWGHAALAKQLDVPIAVGETIFSKYEFHSYLKLGACDILQQDVCRVGGITEWLEIAQLGETNGVKVSPHFVMDMHPSLVVSIPNGMFVEYIPWLRKIFKSPPKIENGLIFPSDSPGIGLELNETVTSRFLAA